MSTHAPAPLVHEANSDSHQNSKAIHAAGKRTKIGSLNLPTHQAVSLPHSQEHTQLVVVNSSPFAYGNLGTLDIRAQGGAVLNAITLQFSLSAVGGTAIVGQFCPSHYFFDHIDVAIGGTVVETIYGSSNFLLTQALHYDEARKSLNLLAGPYDSAPARLALSSTTAPNVFYCKLMANVFKGLHMLNSTSDIQLRIYMNPLSTCFNLVSGTGLTNTITQVAAYCDVTKLGSDGHSDHLVSLRNDAHHRIFHKQTWNSYTVLAGTTQTNIVLTGLSGKVAGFFFTLRASVLPPNQWTYTPVSQWALLDGQSTNICGGLPLPATLCSNYLNPMSSKSSYPSETAYGTNDQKAYYYSFAHSVDLVEALTVGKCLSSRTYNGTEQLQLTFPAATGTALTLDIFAFVETILQHSETSIKSIGM
jgi:hypothetical protein